MLVVIIFQVRSLSALAMTVLTSPLGLVGVVPTGATLAFDAVGGGKLAGQILNAMEAVAVESPEEPYNMYGSSTQKQVYIYGALDPGPIELARVAPAWRGVSAAGCSFTSWPTWVQRSKHG
jgi:hypothetical protein